MRFSPALLDDIRARLPLSAVVGRRLQWDKRKSRPARGDFWACCPFHGEKSPSFHVEDGKGRYHCFGCGVSGDHFKFLVEKEGLSFPEAVERLAEEAGVALPPRGAHSEERERGQASLHEVMDQACRFFEERLASRDGQSARTYLAGRRLGPETQRRFRLGFAPSPRNALREHLAGLGVSVELMVEAGLLVSGDDIPVAFDRFRDRIMFPITDNRGRVVAFGGRALSADAHAKYLNSPETPLFHKGALLYNAAEARKAARDIGTVVVVEGYVDAIAMVVAGFPATVAPLGTALTDRQLELLWQLAPEPILCFDGDKAGIRAAERAIDLALPLVGPGRSLRFAVLPEGQDPDDLIGAGGAEAMREVLGAARPLVDMAWSREIDAAPLDTPERRAALDKRLAGLVETIADHSVRHHYGRAFAERMAALFPPVAERPQRQGGGRFAERFDRSDRSGRPARPAPIRVSDRLGGMARQAAGAALPLREVVLVATIVNHPGILGRHLDEFAALELTSRPLDSLRAQILEIAGNDPAIGAAALRDRLGDRGVLPLLSRLEAQLVRSRTWQASPAAAESDAEHGWVQAATLQRKSRTLHKELSEAEAALAALSSEANLARILDIKSQLASADGVEALVEGFGASSGRPAQAV